MVDYPAKPASPPADTKVATEPRIARADTQMSAALQVAQANQLQEVLQRMEQRMQAMEENTRKLTEENTSLRMKLSSNKEGSVSVALARLSTALFADLNGTGNPCLKIEQDIETYGAIVMIPFARGMARLLKERRDQITDMLLETCTPKQRKALMALSRD